MQNTDDLSTKNALALEQLELLQLLQVCTLVDVQPCERGSIVRDDILEALCDGYGSDTSPEALDAYDRRLAAAIQEVNPSC